MSAESFHLIIIKCGGGPEMVRWGGGVIFELKKAVKNTPKSGGTMYFKLKEDRIIEFGFNQRSGSAQI